MKALLLLALLAPGIVWAGPYGRTTAMERANGDTLYVTPGKTIMYEDLNGNTPSENQYQHTKKRYR